MGLQSRALAALLRTLRFMPLSTGLDGCASTAEMRSVHLAANAIPLRHRPRVVRAVAHLLARAFWPTACAILTACQDQHLLDAACAHSGLSRRQYRWRQWVDCTKLRIRPGEYLDLAFHEPARRARAGDFLMEMENYRLVAYLQEHADIGLLVDKLRFWRFCEERDVPTIPVLARVSARQVEVFSPTDSPLWSASLITKPCSRSGGIGVWRWEFVAPNAYRAPSGDICDFAELIRLLQSAAGHDDMLIQPCAENEPETRRFTNGALATMRLMTGRFASGEVVAIAALIRLPIGTAVVDNFHAGGILAPIDLASGRIAEGITILNPFELITHHPDSGVRFTGEHITGWDRVVQTCLDAHTHLPDFGFVSWDIATTPEGPAIVEANHHGGIVGFQVLPGAPLASSAYADVCQSWARLRPCL